MPDADMHLTAFQQGHLVHTKSLRQLHTHIGETFGMPRQSPRSSLPLVVRNRRRPIRSKSLNPHSYSKSLICRDKADWLMRRCSAALETVPRSATTTKVRRRFRSILLISKTHKE